MRPLPLLSGLSLALLLLCTSAASVSADATVTTFSGFTVQVLGNAGALKIEAPDMDKWIMVSWDSINEVDADGNIVQGKSNFNGAHGDFDVDGPKNDTYTDAAGTEFDGERVTQTISFTVGANPATTVSVTNWVFAEEISVVPYAGAEGFTVPENSLKNSIEITDWPFVSASNRLQLTMNVMSPGSAAKASGTANEEGTAHTFAFPGDSFFTSLDTAMADGDQVTQVQTNVTKVQGTHQFLTFTFQHFNSVLYYDPVLQVRTTNSAQGALAWGVEQKIITVMLAAVAMGAAWIRHHAQIPLCGWARPLRTQGMHEAISQLP